MLKRQSPATFFPLLIAIGTSTGGPKALQDILPRLPADLPVGIVIVQHMPLGFTGPFARRLDSLSAIKVTEATNEENVEPGRALLAPATWDMTLFRTASRFAVRLSKTPENTLHPPSVDVMMLSAPEVCGARTMGVILTGMERWRARNGSNRGKGRMHFQTGRGFLCRLWNAKELR